MSRRLLFTLLAFAFGVNEANAQGALDEFVLAERGDTLIVADFFDTGGTASTLPSVIQADTDAGDVPEGRVYMLHYGRNGTINSGNMALYLNDAVVTEQGRSLNIVGGIYEEGDRSDCESVPLMVNSVNMDNPDGCRPPTLSGYTDASGNNTLFTFSLDDDFTMKNLHFTSAHPGGESDWSMVNVNANDMVVTWDNVLGEHNRWTWINANENNGTEFVVRNSYFVNATDQISRRNGGVYDADQPTARMWIENNTHVQNAGMQYKFRSFSPSEAVFNHNTFVNAAGQIFLGFGYLTNFSATNNLFVNSNYQPYYPGLDQGESYAGDTSVEEFQPHGIINLNYLPTNDNGETFANTAEAYPDVEIFDPADRQILVDLNAAHWDDQLLTIADDLNDAGVEGDVCSESDGCVVDENGDPIPSLDWTTQAILANERTMEMFENDERFPLMTWGEWYQEGAPGFTDGPGMIQALYDWGYDSANSSIVAAELLPKVRTEGNAAGNEIDDEETSNWIVFDWPVIVDLSYDNEAYLEGGYNGFPVGDINWFPEERDDWMAQRDAEYDAIMSALESGEAIGSSIERVESTAPSSQLGQNYPNPFTAEQGTKIEFSLTQAEDVTLEVYDVMGRRVAMLVDRQLAPGSYEVDWDATSSNLSSGTYFYRLTAGQQQVATKQMVLVK